MIYCYKTNTMDILTSKMYGKCQLDLRIQVFGLTMKNKIMPNHEMYNYIVS